MSADALNVLTRFQKEAKAATPSAALEKLPQAHQERRNLAALDAAVASYYDNCTPEELIEQQEWGAFASAQFFKGQDVEGR